MAFAKRVSSHCYGGYFRYVFETCVAFTDEDQAYSLHVFPTVNIGLMRS